jgi:hypothetical protein
MVPPANVSQLCGNVRSSPITCAVGDVVAEVRQRVGDPPNGNEWLGGDWYIRSGADGATVTVVVAGDAGLFGRTGSPAPAGCSGRRAVAIPRAETCRSADQ